MRTYVSCRLNIKEQWPDFGDHVPQIDSSVVSKSGIILKVVDVIYERSLRVEEMDCTILLGLDPVIWKSVADFQEWYVNRR